MYDEDFSQPKRKNADNEPNLTANKSKEEAETKGLALKDEGNVALKDGHYSEAVHHHSMGLSHQPPQ